MKNLFLQETDFGSDIATVSVPQDKAQWDVFIQSELLKKFPNLYGHPLEVKLQDQGEAGAFGAVMIRSGKEESNDIVFPVIIKDYKMFGFDVFNHQDKFHKSTEDNINRALNEEALDLGAHKTRSQGSELGDINFVTPDQNLNIMNPGSVFSGKTVVASAMVGELIKKANVKSLLNDITNKIPELAVSLEKRPMAKLAFVNFVKQANDAIAQNTIKFIPENYLAKAASLKYIPNRYRYEASYSYTDLDSCKVKTASFIAASLDEVKAEMTKREFPEALINKLAEDMKSSDEAYAEVPAEHEVIGETNPDVAKSGFGIVYDNTGSAKKGVLIDKVVDFDLNVLPSKLFLSTDDPGCYAFSENVELKASPEASGDIDKLSSPIEQGATVSFIIKGGEANTPIATFPFKVLSVKNFNGHTAYVGKFIMRDEAVTLIPSQITSSIVPMEKSELGELEPLANTNKVYGIPENIKAVSLDCAMSLDSIKTGEAKFVFKQAGKRREKIAEVVRFGDTIKIKHVDFSNDLLGKLACATLGILNSYDKLLKSASNKKSVFVALPGYTTPKITKTAHKIEKPLKLNRDLLIKAAAGINDENMSMLNLSLGLSDSIDGFKFGDYINTFAEAIDKLSKLLLASRLGMDMSDSSAIKISIDSLDSVISQLRTL